MLKRVSPENRQKKCLDGKTSHWADLLYASTYFFITSGPIHSHQNLNAIIESL